MTTMKKADVTILFENIKKAMEENRQILIDLDSRIGDADLGLTMTHGFAAAYDDVAASTESDLGKLIAKAGMTMAKVAPSTMGTLMATGLLRGGKALMGKTEFGASEAVLFFNAFLGGILERGQAKPGDKTVIDALKPAAEAVEAAVRGNADLRSAIHSGYEAAKAGLERTKDMVSQHGKAAVFREKTLGLPDPGAQAFVFFMDGFDRTLR